jgi:hypothetical protein
VNLLEGLSTISLRSSFRLQVQDLRIRVQLEVSNLLTWKGFQTEVFCSDQSVSLSLSYVSG